MLTPSGCEITRTFYRNLKVVNQNLYEEENDDPFLFAAKLSASIIERGGRRG